MGNTLLVEVNTMYCLTKHSTFFSNGITGVLNKKLLRRDGDFEHIIDI